MEILAEKVIEVVSSAVIDIVVVCGFIRIAALSRALFL